MAIAEDRTFKGAARGWHWRSAQVTTHFLSTGAWGWSNEGEQSVPGTVLST